MLLTTVCSICLRKKEDVIDHADAVDVTPEGNLHVEINAFTYPDESEPVLSEIGFDLKSGETLGIVGRTGSGKTSLLKLLMREYDTYDGEISFADVKFKITLYEL